MCPMVLVSLMLEQNSDVGCRQSTVYVRLEISMGRIRTFVFRMGIKRESLLRHVELLKGGGQSSHVVADSQVKASQRRTY